MRAKDKRRAKKTSGSDVLSRKKKIRKTFVPLYFRGLTRAKLKIIISKTRIAEVARVIRCNRSFCKA